MDPMGLCLDGSFLLGSFMGAGWWRVDIQRNLKSVRMSLVLDQSEHIANSEGRSRLPGALCREQGFTV